MKMNIIFSSIFCSDDYKEDYKQFCEENEIEPTEDGLYDFTNDEISNWYEAEQMNLQVPCGRILAIAKLGLWNGKATAYKEMNGGQVSQILQYFECDEIEVYADRYDVCSDAHHHDGVNHIVFREIKETCTERMLNNLKCKIYNGTATRKDISRCTRSILPKVRGIYGW